MERPDTVLLRRNDSRSGMGRGPIRRLEPGLLVGAIAAVRPLPRWRCSAFVEPLPPDPRRLRRGSPAAGLQTYDDEPQGRRAARGGLHQPPRQGLRHRPSPPGRWGAPGRHGRASQDALQPGSRTGEPPQGHDLAVEARHPAQPGRRPAAADPDLADAATPYRGCSDEIGRGAIAPTAAGPGGRITRGSLLRRRALPSVLDQPLRRLARPPGGSGWAYYVGAGQPRSLQKNPSPASPPPSRS